MNTKLMRVAGALAAVLLAATGCSGDDSTSGDDSAGGKADLTYWSWAPGMDKVVEGWNAAHPDIQVTAEAAKVTNPFTYGPNVNVAFSAYNDAFGKAAESKQAANFTAALTTMQKTTAEDMKNSGFKIAG